MLSSSLKLQELDVRGLAADIGTAPLLKYLLVGSLVYFLLKAVRSIFLSPISHIPGPWAAAAR